MSKLSVFGAQVYAHMESNNSGTSHMIVLQLYAWLIILTSATEHGCPDLTPPAHAWYKRDGDQAVIGCEWSQKTWHLSCDGHGWTGVVGNCSQPGTSFLTNLYIT